MNRKKIPQQTDQNSKHDIEKVFEVSDDNNSNDKKAKNM